MTAHSFTLPSALCEGINHSMATGMPMLVTYWDDKGVANTSWRGSTHVHADGQLAMWIRSKAGGLPRAIRQDSRMIVAYRNPHTRSFVTFTGEAQLETTDDGNAGIFADTTPIEQRTDPEGNGVGVVLRLTRVSGTFEGKDIAIEA